MLLSLNKQYRKVLLIATVWYHRYHVSWTHLRGTGGPTMSQPTRPKGRGQEAHN
jgi:hypothetical protein